MLTKLAKTLLPSPRNSLQGQLSLLEKMECHCMLSASNSAVEDILNERPMTHVIVPDLRKLLREEPKAVYPYNWTFESAEHEPFIVLHTSGSTGLPKPIVWTHGSITSCDAQNLLPTFNGYESQAQLWKRRRIFSGLPPFHVCVSAHLGR